MRNHTCQTDAPGELDLYFEVSIFSKGNKYQALRSPLALSLLGLKASLRKWVWEWTLSRTRPILDAPNQPKTKSNW